MPSVVTTARWAAAQRANENDRPDRLIADPLARALAGEEGFAALRNSEETNPRHEDSARYVATRVRFFDDLAQRAIAEGIRQFVVPAAGMDARAFRLPWPEGTTLYEIDHPESFEIKNAILAQQRAEPKCRHVTIAANLEQNWPPLLTASGFDSSQRSAWLIEGLFYYLHEPAVHHVLNEISKLAAPGSMLVTDFVSRWMLESPWMKPSLEAMEKAGFGWHFGTDDPAALFAQHGWTTEVSNPQELGYAYNPQRFPKPEPGPAWSYFAVASRMQK